MLAAVTHEGQEAQTAGTPGAAGVAVLVARGVSKLYGRFKAVDSVDLDVFDRRVHALVGPNGAGKTTVLNLLGGQILPTTGDVLFEGRSLGTSKPARRARAGIGRSFQLTSVLATFTCIENVVMAVQARRGMLRLLRPRSYAEDTALAHEILARVGLDDRAGVIAGQLAHGQQRQLEVAIALGARPRVLLLDEPSSGMSPHERQNLAGLLRQVASATAVVMVEHDVHLVRSVADTVTAFSEGRKLIEGTAEQVFAAPEVQRVFLRGLQDV